MDKLCYLSCEQFCVSDAIFKCLTDGSGICTHCHRHVGAHLKTSEVNIKQEPVSKVLNNSDVEQQRTKRVKFEVNTASTMDKNASAVMDLMDDNRADHQSFVSAVSPTPAYPAVVNKSAAQAVKDRLHSKLKPPPPPPPMTLPPPPPTAAASASTILPTGFIPPHAITTPSMAIAPMMSVTTMPFPLKPVYPPRRRVELVLPPPALSEMPGLLDENDVTNETTIVTATMSAASKAVHDGTSVVDMSESTTSGAVEGRDYTIDKIPVAPSTTHAENNINPVMQNEAKDGDFNDDDDEAGGAAGVATPSTANGQQHGGNEMHFKHTPFNVPQVPASVPVPVPMKVNPFNGAVLAMAPLPPSTDGHTGQMFPTFQAFPMIPPVAGTGMPTAATMPTVMETDPAKLQQQLQQQQMQLQWLMQQQQQQQQVIAQQQQQQQQQGGASGGGSYFVHLRGSTVRGGGGSRGGGGGFHNNRGGGGGGGGGGRGGRRGGGSRGGHHQSQW